MKSATSNKKLPNLLFVGLAKDIRQALHDNLQYLLEIAENNCQDYRFIIVENDSTDGTKELLLDLAAKNPKIIALTHQENQPSAITHGSHSNKRFHIMAHWRNKYIEECKKPEYDTFNHVCVLDLDHTVGTTEKALETCFETSTDWDMVSANGMNARYLTPELSLVMFALNDYYYDRVAYRDINYQRVRGHSPVKPKETFIKIPFFDPKKPEWIRITSAFGGMTLYRKQALTSAAYDGYDCEHICLHDKMIDQGFTKMFINPNFILWH
jgi:glycosyltransferase involved in cell wall biosynthesis